MKFIWNIIKTMIVSSLLVSSFGCGPETGSSQNLSPVNGNGSSGTGSNQSGLPPLTLSPITLGLASLSYGGTTSVSVTVIDANGVLYTAQDVDVVFSSTQATAGYATINSPIRSVNGVATATYQALTVVGSDTIKASISGSSVTTSLSVNPLAASAISFVSASPVNIGLKGMGGAGIQETSKITFKVIDTAGQPKANQPVDFSLNTTIGGLSLSSASASSASDGTVSVFVQAGIIATSVRVTATLTGTTIATQSDQLVVSTGVPAQDGFSISIETLNPETWNIDGVVDKVTARLSDHFHNPVPDGTAVYFTTSGGSIQPSCTTIAGACSVNWTSQDPRPANGRARILAYAVGEEAFLDLNGNGLADAGEFSDDSEAFRDDNENNIKDAGETPIDFNGDGVFGGPDGRYNGVLQGSAYVGAPKSKHVFSNSTLVMASSSANISSTCGPVSLGSYTNCFATVSDVNGNTMPAGTTVAFKLTTLIPGSTVGLDSTTETALAMPVYDTYTFPNTTADTGVAFSIMISDKSLTTSASGSLEIKVTSPGGLVTTGAYRIN
ncbi:MAG: hypothetical protein PHF56_02575 [Desulfuromonadaceae bacterium]|nr:hypothetical protein [Desulfuromonadaceae bacterium]